MALILCGSSEVLALGEPAKLTEKGKVLATVDGELLPLSEGWYTRIETNHGPIIARLHPEQAPQSVAHFAGLAEGSLAWTDPSTGEEIRKPYYDGTRVHKAKAGRQFEFGVPATRTGQPPDLFISPEEANKPINFSQPYKIGMTRAPLGRISAAVVFVSAASLPYLNGRHPCFGTVIYGEETILSITDSRTYSNNRPMDDVEIQWVRIFKAGQPKPLADIVKYKPKVPKLEYRGDTRPSGR